MATDEARSPDAPPGRRQLLSFGHVAWALVYVGLVLDVTTTTVGLSRGLAESNPIVRGVMVHLGPLGAMVALKGVVFVVGVAAWSRCPEPYRNLVPAGMEVPWLLAGTANAVLLVRTAG